MKQRTCVRNLCTLSNWSVNYTTGIFFYRYPSHNYIYEWESAPGLNKDQADSNPPYLVYSPLHPHTHPKVELKWNLPLVWNQPRQRHFHNCRRWLNYLPQRWPGAPELLSQRSKLWKSLSRIWNISKSVPFQWGKHENNQPTRSHVGKHEHPPIPPTEGQPPPSR